MKTRLHYVWSAIHILVIALHFLAAAGLVFASDGHGSGSASRPSDEKLAGEVRAELSAEPALADSRLTVEVSEGTVRLTGAVGDYADSTEAVEAVGNVRGVTGVVENLSVDIREESPGGAQLERRVRALLRRNALLDSSDIRVEVVEHEVSLSGSLDSAWLKHYVAREVGDLAGISKLHNELAVVPAEDVTDERIAQKLSASLELESGIDPDAVDLEVADGVVTLSRAVGSQQAARDAVERARATQGVRRVQNELQVRPSAGTPDTPETIVADGNIGAQVRTMLASDVVVDAADIWVSVKDGTVTLRGSVDSAVEKQRAASDAWSVAGVVGVNNRLLVDSPHDVGPSALADDFGNALSARASVDERDIRVAVHGSQVVLRGATDTAWQKHRAEEVARSIVGVESVENRLAVVPTESIEDQRLAERIVAALQRSAIVDPEDITVEVEAGKVMLTGNVESHDARKAAVEAARELVGVTSVRTNLHIG